MRKDNKGFTLVEVMIAVIIMAIVLIPMLRSFSTAYNVNAKSRRIMRATTLAQNEMEIFEREKIEVLKSDKYDYDVTETSDVTDSGTDDELEHIIYTFTRDGVINDESGRDMFDVVVTLDPKANDIYNAQNTTGLLVMNTLSAVDSGTYVQRVRNNVNEDGEDEEVYSLFITRQHPEGFSQSNLNIDYFKNTLERTITLTIEQAEQDGLTTTVAKVNYKYTAHYDEVDVGYDAYSPGDKVIFNNAQSLDEEGNPIELNSIYLLYAPRYDYAKSSTGKADEIIIENRDNLPVNIYILRQNIRDSADNLLGVYTDDFGNVQNTVPADYYASIRIYDALNEEEGGTTYGNYYTNLNLPGASGNGVTELTLYDTDHADTPYTGNMAIVNTKMQSLGGTTETKDRIYSMSVEVYVHGADPDNDEPLVSMTGTKIE